MTNRDSRYAGRALDFCVGVLLAAMALYAAVEIIRAIWIYLCLLAAVIVLAALVWWWVNTRYSGW